MSVGILLQRGVDSSFVNCEMRSGHFDNGEWTRFF